MKPEKSDILSAGITITPFATKRPATQRPRASFNYYTTINSAKKANEGHVFRLNRKTGEWN